MADIETISTPDAPAALGPYSQALRANGTIYCSGQVPLDPKTGEIVEGGIEAQTRRVLANLRAVLKAAGSDFNRLLQTMVYLTDMNDFSKVNAICAELYDGAKPTRTCVQVVALPRGAKIKIDAIAI